MCLTAPATKSCSTGSSTPTSIAADLGGYAELGDGTATVARGQRPIGVSLWIGPKERIGVSAGLAEECRSLARTLRDLSADQLSTGECLWHRLGPLWSCGPPVCKLKRERRAAPSGGARARRGDDFSLA